MTRNNFAKNRKDYLEKEVATLSQIPLYTLQRLSLLQTDIIAHLVAEAKAEGWDNVLIEIGYGTLFIQFTEEAISYTFKPDKNLQEAVRLASVHGTSKLEINAEDSLAQKIKETYTELL